MKSFAAVMLAVASASTMEQSFMQYMTKYGKSYGTRAEFEFRMARFMEAQEAINQINNARGTSTAGHNFTSDWTEEEFKRILSYKEVENEYTGDFEEVAISTDALPDAVDWRTSNAVTAVKDQGQCGSCWAFSSTGALEGAHAVATGELLSLAEQQLVDCAGLTYGNMGCNGGRQSNAFRYTKSHALVQEADYPYTATGGKCNYDESKAVVGATGFTSVPKKDPAQLKAAIALQPVSVTVQANKPAFHYYTGGIVTEDCGGWHLDHAVLAVGYGSENGQEYYLVKNSWSADWGEDGYIRIGIEDGIGVCGIQKTSLYPQV